MKLLVGRLFVFFSLLLGLNSLAQNEDIEILDYQDAPSALKKAVRPSVWLIENQIKSQLDGRSDGHLLIDLQLETFNGFYVYANKMSFEVESDPALSGASWELEVLETPESYRFFDPFTDKFQKGYKGSAVFRLKASFGQALEKPLDAKHRLPLVVGFQACSDKTCLFPYKIRAPLETGFASVVSRPKENFLERSSAELKEALEMKDGLGLWGILVLFLAGVLTCFTPCVYPLYPITLGIFSRWSEKSHASPMLLSLAYCLGMTFSYASLGLFAAATGQVFASISQTPAFLIGMGLLIFVSALFFSGLFNFQLPSFIVRLFSGGNSKEEENRSGLSQLVHAAGMGLGLGVVASPCVGPVLLALLAWLGSSINAEGSDAYLRGFVLLSIFGLGMSFPFLLIGHLTIRLKKHLSVGRFTPYVKHLGTTLMIVASLFFLVPGFQMLTASEHQSSFPFPTHTLTEFPKDRWLLIDFRADWCAACIQLENESFRHPLVTEMFEKDNWSFISQDFTQMTPENKKIAKDYDVVSLPTVLIQSPDGKVCRSQSLHQFEGAEDLAQRMQAAMADCR